MLAAEAGADYVMFGEPDAELPPALLRGDRERVAWWAEVFEIPCVGFAATLDEVAPLAAAGADFVAVGDCVSVTRTAPLRRSRTRHAGLRAETVA